MAMTKTGMASKIQVLLKAASFPAQKAGTMNQTEIDAYQLQYLEEFCQGIIDEIVANAEIVTTSGAPDSEHSGNVSA